MDRECQARVGGSALSAAADAEEAEAAVRTLLAWAGDDPSARVWSIRRAASSRPTRSCSPAIGDDPDEALARVFNDVEGYSDIVVVRDIPFVSHCEHHIAPFFGKAHIGYYPRGGAVGLSKLARVVEMFARRLQTQEGDDRADRRARSSAA